MTLRTRRSNCPKRWWWMSYGWRTWWRGFGNVCWSDNSNHVWMTMKTVMTMWTMFAIFSISFLQNLLFSLRKKWRVKLVIEFYYISVILMLIFLFKFEKVLIEWNDFLLLFLWSWPLFDDNSWNDSWIITCRLRRRRLKLMITFRYNWYWRRSKS